MPHYYLPDGTSVYTEQDIPDEKLPDFFKTMGASGHIEHPETNPAPVISEPKKDGAWDTISKPLTTKPSEWAKSVADYIDPRSLNESVMDARIHGFAGGMVQGLGDFASSLTSPLDLATYALTEGAGTAAKRGLATTAKLASIGARGAGALMAGHGGYKVVNPSSTLAERGQGLVELAGGILGLRGNLHSLSNKLATSTEGLPEIDLSNLPADFGKVSSKDLPTRASNAASNIANRDKALIDASNEAVNNIKPENLLDDKVPANVLLKRLNAIREGRNPADLTDTPNQLEPEPTVSPKFSNKQLKPNKDGTFTNINTGEVVDKSGNPVDEPGSVVKPVDKLKVIEPDAILGPEPSIQDRASKGEIVVDYNDRNENGDPYVYNKDGRGFHGYANKKSLFFIEDAERMRKEAEIFNRKDKQGNFIDPKRQKQQEDMNRWNKTQENLRKNAADTKQAKEILKNDYTDDELFSMSEEKLFNKAAAKDPNFQHPWNEPDESITNEPIKEVKGSTVKQLPSTSNESTLQPNETPAQYRNRTGQNTTLEEDIPTKPTRGGDKIPVEPNVIRKIWDTTRGLMSVDPPFVTSAAFRQAAPTAWSKEWFKAWHTAAKSFASEDIYNAKMNEIKSHPLFQERVVGKKVHKSFADEIGLRMTDLKDANSTRLQGLKSQLSERIPVYGKYVKASNRAFASFLNDIRFNKLTREVTNTQRLAELKNNPELSLTKNIPLAKVYAEWLNDATGAGTLQAGFGKHQYSLEKNAQILADWFFSPRLMARNVRMLNPSSYITGPTMVRKKYMEGALRTAATWMGMAQLARMSGAKVVTDPNNADFGKIKFGNTRIDTGVGLQQLMVLMHRIAPATLPLIGEAKLPIKPTNTGFVPLDLATGYLGTSGGKYSSSISGTSRPYGVGYNPPTRLEAIKDFGMYHLHPAAGLIAKSLDADERKKVYLGDQALQMALPMMAGDMADIINEHPDLKPILLSLAAGSVGFGGQTYSGAAVKPQITPLIRKLTGFPADKMDMVIGGK